MYFLYKSQLYIEDLKQTLEQVEVCDRLKESAVLVAGASGLIGSFIVDLLLTANKYLKTNITVYAIGRSKKRLQERFDGIETDRLLLIEQDINEPLEIDLPVDYIIHGASNAYPAAFRENPVDTIMSNILGTYHLLEYGRLHGGKRLLYVSSGEVYGQGSPAEEAFQENYSGYINILEPRSCYPSGKRAAETLCCSYYQQYGAEVVIVRPCHTYGPNMSVKDNRATAQFIGNALRGEDIVLKSSGSQLRSYCYVADCVSALLTVLIKGSAGEAYNLANPDSRLTIAQFAQRVAELSGHQLIFENPDPTALQERSPIDRQVLDSKKLETLGWKGKYDPEKGIRHTLKILGIG